MDTHDIMDSTGPHEVYTEVSNGGTLFSGHTVKLAVLACAGTGW